MSEFELEATGIVKRYGAVLANDHVDLAVRQGEIHAVMGENGAGKSTLMGILYGLQQPDEGIIRLCGKDVRFRSALDAIAEGMGMVHQAFKLFNSLTVRENITYGREPQRAGFIDRRAAEARVAELAARYQLAVDPKATVGKLSVGVRQRVEILKALYRDARVLILDEPTAVLTPQERDALFAVMRRLAADGRTILFVTHKIHEVMAVTDRVTVLRDGRVAARMATRETSEAEIVKAMTGRAVSLRIAKGTARPGAPVLEATGLTVANPGGRPLLDAVSLTVRGGEIVGIAGVAGNGQTELIEVLTGARPADAGTVRINGTDVSTAGVEAHRAAGLAYIPEDRAIVGTALPASGTANLAMGFHRHPPLARHGILDLAAMAARARDLIGRFGIRIASERLPVGTLSGGNLQKVVVARELAHAAPALIAEQPTRGVDVGAIEFIHGQLLAERDRGCAILLVSAELGEILALSDRILVMYEGRILADLPAAEADEQRLGLLMAGRTAAAAAA
ncbi:MAG: ABC transporter ATP-binding protein [Rhizobiales bacterium]|nr:ABC transporter ATP-binding protein [Hyphomicrobiales bacterium]